MNWEGETAEAAWRVIGYDRSYSEGERRSGFNTGARWQRDRFRSDEAVERVAYAYQANVKRNRTERLPDLPAETQDYYRAVAKSMIAALFDEDWTVEP